jgi:hypothetical protein
MITPADSPSSPADYAGVPVQGMDIQAPQADLAGAFDAANAVSGAGVLYAQGPRQQQTEKLIQSPPGYGEFNITAGYSGGGGEDWPGDVAPSA